MKYFVCSDIHGFYSILKNELKDAKFDIKNKNHILIICGDLFDRGQEAKKLLDFLLSIPKDRLILIKGNHEDLLEDCLNELLLGYNISRHHLTNKTLNTIAQLTNINEYNLLTKCYNYNKLKKKLKRYFELTNRCKNYYELDKYIFVHGWIPYDIKTNRDWHIADDYFWKQARWINGMKAAIEDHYIVKDKIIICGHWNTSYGHYRYNNFGNGEYNWDSCFYPFVDDGIIAIDACTAISHKINIIKIEV